MTSAISGSSAAYQRSSPIELLKKTLETQVSSGTIASGDEAALSSALDSIDASIGASRGNRGAKESGDPKAKIDALIDAQVSAGNLTSDQAEELRGVFSATFSAPPQGAGGPPPGPPPGEANNDDDEDSVTSASSETTGNVDIAALLQELMKKVSETNASYTGSGTASATGASSSLFFDRAV